MIVQKYVFYLRFGYKLYFIKDKMSYLANSIKNLSPLYPDLRGGQTQCRAAI